MAFSEYHRILKNKPLWNTPLTPQSFFNTPGLNFIWVTAPLPYCPAFFGTVEAQIAAACRKYTSLRYPITNARPVPLRCTLAPPLGGYKYWNLLLFKTCRDESSEKPEEHQSVKSPSATKSDMLLCILNRKINHFISDLFLKTSLVCFLIVIHHSSGSNVNYNP